MRSCASNHTQIMTEHISICDQRITVKHCFELHGADLDQSSAIPCGRQGSPTQDNEDLCAWNLHSQSMVGPVLKQASWLLTVPCGCGLSLCHFAFLFYKDNKLGKCVSFHKCDTVQKACWKKNHIPECWSWKPPSLALRRKRCIASSSSAASVGVWRSRACSRCCPPHTGPYWWLELNWKSAPPPLQCRLLKSQGRHPSLSSPHDGLTSLLP